MLAPYPRLRGDLRKSRQHATDGDIFVIKDPLSGRFFRLREPEFLIAGQLDGVTDLESIRRNMEGYLGVAVDSETVAKFVRQLEHLQLLERSAPEKAPISPARLWRGDLLYLRLKAVDPDRLLTMMVRPLRFFFTPAFLAISAAAIVLALGITASNWKEIWLHLSRLYRFDALALAWITVLAVTVFHEFAHGLTCKYFGGQVREMGFLLLYFQPAMYCNVSDAWLFPEKSRRLWVTFSGGYFEAFLWALATIAWRISEPGTMVNFVSLVVMATSGVKFAININPLIKLDGYYFLSDYLEIPNLRQRSFAYLGARLRTLSGHLAEVPAATPRERRIYTIYGLLAGAYSAWLLGWVSWHMGGFLVGRYQALGLVLFMVFLTMLFHRPIRTASLRIRAMLQGGIGTVAAFRTRRAKSIVATLAIAGLLVILPVELKLTGEFTILPAHNADVRAEVEGIIAEIFVNEGDSVPKGRALVRLSDQEQRSQLASIAAAIDEKRARLKLLESGPRSEEVSLARTEVSTAVTKRSHAKERYEEAVRLESARLSRAQTAVKAAAERLAYSTKDLERFTDLFSLGLVSRSQLEERQQQARLRQTELDQARDELTLASVGDTAQLRQELAVFVKEAEQAEGRLKVLRAGSRREELEATHAEIAQLVARQELLSQQLKMTRIVSPAAGVIVTPRLKERVGQHVNRGDLIAEVYELETVAAEIAVSEKDIADVRIAAPVALKARAYPEKTFVGAVGAIAPAAVTEGDFGARVFRVRVDIQKDPAVLKPEMTGTAKIFGGKRSLFTILTRRLARVLRVEFWSWW